MRNEVRPNTSRHLRTILLSCAETPNLERLINWRLYKEFSKGLMTELACHQLQIGSWALRKIPEKVMGHGAITYDSETMSEDVSLVTSNSCIPKTDEVSEGVSLVISEDAVSELVVSEEMVSGAEDSC